MADCKFSNRSSSMGKPPERNTHTALMQLLRCSFSFFFEREREKLFLNGQRNGYFCLTLLRLFGLFFPLLQIQLNAIECECIDIVYLSLSRTRYSRNPTKSHEVYALRDKKPHQDWCTSLLEIQILIQIKDGAGGN